MTTLEDGQTAFMKQEPQQAGCAGDGCNARDPWPLHHVRHRTVFNRLCTSCVLKYHSGSFCVSCFDLLDATGTATGASSPPPTVVRCSNCPSVSHYTCLPDPGSSPYVCPSCSDSNGFSYFPMVSGKGDLAGGWERSINLKSAKALLTAAQLAYASMTRAAACAKTEAERKVREAVVAKKRARDLIEKSLLISHDEMEEKKKKKQKESTEVVAASPNLREAVDPKMKVPKLSSTVAAMVGQKRVVNREADRWMRFQEPIGMIKRPAESELKTTPLSGMKNQNNSLDPKDKSRSLSYGPNYAGQVAREEKKVLQSSQGALVKEEEAIAGTC